MTTAMIFLTLPPSFLIRPQSQLHRIQKIPIIIPLSKKIGPSDTWPSQCPPRVLGEFRYYAANRTAPNSSTMSDSAFQFAAPYQKDVLALPVPTVILKRVEAALALPLTEVTLRKTGQPSV